MKSLLNVFQRISKGNNGEVEVIEAITKLLKGKGKYSNFFILPKIQIEDFNSSREVDVILLHPVYGIFVIEVKNWTKLDISKNNPFEQAKQYRNLLLGKIKDRLGEVPINVEFRIIFPSLTYEDAREFFKEHASLNAYKINSFFKEDLQAKENFKRFFKTQVTCLPNKKQFLEVASLLIDKKKIAKTKDKILPIISNDEILFFDHKQLSVLNGYTDGFRIIRGVAGTGKTVILSHFINNRLHKDCSEKFLVLCFNKKLVNNLENIFEENKYKKNINIKSILGFLKEIKFDYKRIGLDENSYIEDKFEVFEGDVAISEFRKKLKEYLKFNPIDYVICDETQDMPKAFIRLIYEEIQDCIFFIDEAQKFYPYSMDSIAQVFHHPKFEKISMQGRVKNLKNVYRTPSNISKCAFEILSKDTKINQYYKRAKYLNNDFLNDINCVLEDGNIYIDDWDKFIDLENLLKKQKEETIVLTHSKNQKAIIEDIVRKINKDDVIRVMTMQSVKGLEAKNIIIHSFNSFLHTSYNSDKNIFFRKIYVLITRSQKNLYLSISEQNISSKIEEVVNILKKYSTKNMDENCDNEENTLKGLSKLTNLPKPSREKLKETGEFIVLGAELFSIIAGLFAL
ncbi:nuclease-related domain-containing DEAD/DEAH box helicase [Phocoenobacter skyensis]|uniref:DNA 3'-5' helicase II n=1 Tax=Phocoenobacter skyensis TaxID=97481 RepID=A0A1H7W900_9PAST|nr:NERD domain-containing protein [Pasteurella skyensis]MDP8079147.1 NERD domain-containing protein [Pasteurella skyensis]MDP8085097.1 NERD domain-containing protein [Pasteurella skyensis]MDP8185008.1 NERD domain-containing protein [Pasteurella skyensis]QLB23061.1 hypothetical protein A6B44_07540 [Pasteurella skyensis]SEM17478.1 Superfamily I DNA and RNA helicases [Pasteurella skyensis]